MSNNRYRRESHYWLATAYHEAGHAIVILLVGRELQWIELTSHSSGAVGSASVAGRVEQLMDEASRHGRMPAELLRLWREECLICDAGIIAETEFNLVSDRQQAVGALGDTFYKLTLIPQEDRYAFVRDYFHRNVGRWSERIKEDCRQLFRQPRVAALTRTLAEVLLRTKHMDGETVIDTLLANRESSTRQRDLFWESNVFVEFCEMQMPKQMRLW